MTSTTTMPGPVRSPAAFGGVTTIIDQAQVPPGTTLRMGLEQRLEELRPCLIDYGVHVNLREPSRARVAEIPAIVEMGFPSIKLFMNYDGYALPDTIIFAAMQEVAAANGLAIVHAENREIIDELDAPEHGSGAHRAALASERSTGRARG